MNDYDENRGVSWGCILGGCLGVFVLMVLGVVGAGFFGYRYVSQQIDQYTSDTPVVLPTVTYSDEQLESLKSQFQWLKDAGSEEAKLTPEPIELTADDINALIGQESKLQGRVHIAIEDGQLTAQVSIPLDEIPGAKGRYFNGFVTLSAEVADGQPVVRIENAEVNGEAVPQAVIDSMKQVNFAEESQIEINGKKIELESIVIEDNKLIVTPKATVETQPADDPQATDEPQPVDESQPAADAATAG